MGNIGKANAKTLNRNSISSDEGEPKSKIAV